MTLSTFFQDSTNMLMAGAAVGLGLYLLYFELTNLGSAKTKVSPAKLTRLINDGAMVIDLRKAEDFRQSHIKGATNIPLENLAAKIDGLNKEKPIVVYCYQGVSSNKAIKQLTKAGLNATQLLGGFASWTKDGLPVAKK